jgi:uncharacterized ferritin-like protein (DUF455 family)
MELRDFAERVLFATTLADKLSCPAEITDECPGPALMTPVMPGRPTALAFKPQGAGKGDFPGTNRLENASERGRLLHFFANHELLATELMALVLLKFPDAPAAFRRGVLQTLRDEQEHTRLYAERMRACGLGFGDLPVSGYFWRAVSGMANPMDYVAGLSLTFEQANLDFARHFSEGFAAVGDAESAALLKRIYRDEIGHVAYGLKWFRRWKNPTQTDWDAFCGQLKFPLTPRRAKGFSVNFAGRNAAGLDADFIAHLDVYSQSKGRTPNVYWFNPLSEAVLAQGRSFTPVRAQAELVQDLANLPQFLAREDDVVLVSQRPAVEFLRGLKRAGIPLPEFVELESGQPPRTLSDRKLGQLRPWAWGPDSAEVFAPLFNQCPPRQRPLEVCVNERVSELYSKASSAEFFRRWTEEFTQANQAIGQRFLCPVDDIGVAVSTLPEALAAIRGIRDRGHHRVVAKQALGLAGQNALRLWEPELLPNQSRWLEGVFAQGRTIVIEPWLDRVADFSVQTEMTDRDLELVGYAGLLNDARGQFQANTAAPDFARRLPSVVAECFRGQSDFARTLPRLYPELLLPLLAKRLDAIGFRGPLGIDAFAYRDQSGDLRLKPVVEVNPRYTMGRITLELMRFVAPGSSGEFRLVNRAQLRASGAPDFAALANQLQTSDPPVLGGVLNSRIRRGTVCLTNPRAAKSCLATWRVSAGGGA